MTRKKIGFVIDPLDGFDSERETTLYLMAEAQRRGHEIWAFTLPGLSYQSPSLFGDGFQLEVRSPPVSSKSFYKILHQRRVDLTELDVLFLRKDPPVDLAFTHHLYLLQTLSAKVFMVNEPLGILKASEKIYPLQFKEAVPNTLIGCNFLDALAFAKHCSQGVVLKPLNSSGGRGVFYLKSDDSNFKVAFDALSENGQQYLICQEYLPQVKVGDKRVLLLNGEILGYFIRVPQKGQHRANLHSGGKLKKCTLSSREKKIALEVGEVLRADGLWFVGIDLIGEKLTEINVTSPMGIREVQQTLGGNPERQVIDFVEGGR